MFFAGVVVTCKALEINTPMNSKLKVAGIAIGIAALVSVIGFCWFFLVHDAGTLSVPYSLQQEGKNSPLAESDPFINQMVTQLQKCYSKTIAQKSTQAGLFEIRDFIVGTHPANGKAVFIAILTRAFPDYAHEILKTLEKLDLYNRWLEDNKKMLLQMTDAERSVALWEKRRELFGDDADKIWSGDMLATEARKAKVQDALAALNESHDTSIDEKLDMYQSTLREAYGDTPEKFILEQNGFLSKVFFSIDSVQDELKQMNPDQRQLVINNIRRKMGYTEEDIERSTKRDADNEQRWQVGYKYMEERDKIVKEYQGQELENQLDLIREKYFQDEANTIKLEEKDDFFRFKRPHIYGRN
jgi:hypothetical protein